MTPTVKIHVPDTIPPPGGDRQFYMLDKRGMTKFLVHRTIKHIYFGG